VVLIPTAAQAQGQTRHAAVHFGLGTLSVVSTVVYGSAKFVYAVLGSAPGGLAYVITGFDGDVARRIIQPAVRGDYVVTPENLTAEMPLVFVGRDPYGP
jgi:hypothetical protein